MAGATLTTTSGISSQFRAFFSKDLLPETIQNTRWVQFTDKQSVPKRAGAKSITLYRFGNPSIADIQSLSEGVVTSGTATAHQLSLSSITKSLSQYGHSIALSDIMSWTQFLDHGKQAMKQTHNNIALFLDGHIRNVAAGVNVTISGNTIGTGQEGGGTLDNSDVLQEYYGTPSALTTQTYSGLNSSTVAAEATCTASALLDLVTKLRNNVTPEVKGGGYAYLTDHRVARDLMRDADWLSVKEYQDKKDLYNGEVGELYGARVVLQTNSFVSQGSGTAADAYIYSTAGGNGLATGKNVLVSFMLGNDAVAIPALDGSDPGNPEVTIVDKADHYDIFGQTKIIATKVYFAALRKNPNYYIVHRCKTAFGL